MRVVEYHVDIDGQTTPESVCLATDLLDHHTHTADLLAQAYRWRWDGSETALREAKWAIHDAGPGRAILRSASPELIRQTRGLDRRHRARPRRHRSAAAMATPFRRGPRTGQPVAARQLSFTTARRTLIATCGPGPPPPRCPNPPGPPPKPTRWP